jgi:hypothetical protein
MAAGKKARRPFKVGDWVKIRYSGVPRGRIVEERGAIGAGGALLFRVQLRRKPSPVFTEVREEQLIHLPDKARSSNGRQT